MQRSRQTLAQSETMLLQAQRLARIGHFTFDRGDRHPESVRRRTTNCSASTRAKSSTPRPGGAQLIHPDDRERMSEYSRDHVFRKAGQPFDNEYRLIRRNDGQERWIHGTVGQLACSATGRVSRLFGTSQDITERKQFEQRLSQSEAELKEAQAVAHLRQLDAGYPERHAEVERRGLSDIRASRQRPSPAEAGRVSSNAHSPG